MIPAREPKQNFAISSLPLSLRIDPWNSLLCGCWGHLQATFVNGQIIGIRSSVATGPALRIPLPTGKSLAFTALMLLGLPWGYLGATFADEQIIKIPYSRVTGCTEATLADKQGFGIRCSVAAGATLGPCGLCQAIFAMHPLRAYLRPKFANQTIILMPDWSKRSNEAASAPRSPTC